MERCAACGTEWHRYSDTPVANPLCQDYAHALRVGLGSEWNARDWCKRYTEARALIDAQEQGVSGA